MLSILDKDKQKKLGSRYDFKLYQKKHNDIVNKKKWSIIENNESNIEENKIINEPKNILKNVLNVMKLKHLMNSTKIKEKSLVLDLIAEFVKIISQVINKLSPNKNRMKMRKNVQNVRKLKISKNSIKIKIKKMV